MLCLVATQGCCCSDPGCDAACQRLLFGWHYVLVYRYLSNTASRVLCAVRSVHKLPDRSPLLKKAYVRQVVLDNWFPLILYQMDCLVKSSRC